MVKINLTNKTGWETKDLKKLVKSIFNHRGNAFREYNMIVKHGKYHDWRQAYSGWAYLNGNKICMKVPGVVKKEIKFADDGRAVAYDFVSNEFDVKTFSQVLCHEIDHTFGLKHREMNDCKDFDVSFTDGITVNPKKQIQKPKVDVVKKRYDHVLKMIGKKETALKRLQTSLKKLYQKKGYYERKSRQE